MADDPRHNTVETVIIAALIVIAMLALVWPQDGATP